MEFKCKNCLCWQPSIARSSGNPTGSGICQAEPMEIAEGTSKTAKVETYADDGCVHKFFPKELGAEAFLMWKLAGRNPYEQTTKKREQ